jgi:hypothetical protein
VLSAGGTWAGRGEAGPTLNDDTLRHRIDRNRNSCNYERCEWRQRSISLSTVGFRIVERLGDDGRRIGLTVVPDTLGLIEALDLARPDAAGTNCASGCRKSTPKSGVGSDCKKPCFGLWVLPLIILMECHYRCCHRDVTVRYSRNFEAGKLFR